MHISTADTVSKVLYFCRKAYLSAQAESHANCARTIILLVTKQHVTKDVFFIISFIKYTVLCILYSKVLALFLHEIVFFTVFILFAKQSTIEDNRPFAHIPNALKVTLYPIQESRTPALGEPVNWGLSPFRIGSMPPGLVYIFMLFRSFECDL